MDHFFTSSSWNNTHQNPVQPVRSVINGTRTSTSHGTSESHQVHQIYDFFDFVTGPPHDYEFEIPSITYCPGKKNTNFVSLPTPKWFSFETETVFVENKTIRHFRVWFESFYFFSISLKFSSLSSVCPSIHRCLPVRLLVQWFVRLFVCWSIGCSMRSIRPFVCLSLRSFVRPFVRQSVCPFVFRRFIYPFVFD